MQESARKDVERCFGVLQARFAIVKGASRFWNEKGMADIMKTCIILHYMIVEDERDDTAPDHEYAEPFASSAKSSDDESTTFNEFLQRYRAIRDMSEHYLLRNNLIEHLRKRKGDL